MLVQMLLPSNPQICLDPNRKTELDTIVSNGFRAVLVGAVDCQTHLEGGNVFQEIDSWLQQDSEGDLNRVME